MASIGETCKGGRCQFRQFQNEGPEDTFSKSSQTTSRLKTEGLASSRTMIVSAGIAAPTGSIAGERRSCGKDATSHRRAKSRRKTGASRQPSITQPSEKEPATLSQRISRQQAAGSGQHSAVTYKRLLRSKSWPSAISAQPPAMGSGSAAVLIPSYFIRAYPGCSASARGREALFGGGSLSGRSMSAQATCRRPRLHASDRPPPEAPPGLNGLCHLVGEQGRQQGGRVSLGAEGRGGIKRLQGRIHKIDPCPAVKVNVNKARNDRSTARLHALRLRR